MCHGSIDAKVLMRDAEDRYRATASDPAATREVSDCLPPELMGGLRGVWVRIATLVRVKAAG